MAEGGVVPYMLGEGNIRVLMVKLLALYLNKLGYHEYYDQERYNPEKCKTYHSLDMCSPSYGLKI